MNCARPRHLPLTASVTLFLLVISCISLPLVDSVIHNDANTYDNGVHDAQADLIAEVLDLTKDVAPENGRGGRDASVRGIGRVSIADTAYRASGSNSIRTRDEAEKRYTVEDVKGDAVSSDLDSSARGRGANGVPVYLATSSEVQSESKQTDSPEWQAILQQQMKENFMGRINHMCEKPFKVHDDVVLTFANPKTCVDYPKRSGGVSAKIFGKTLSGTLAMAEDDVQKLNATVKLPTFENVFGVKGLTVRDIEGEVDVDVGAGSYHMVQRMKLCGGTTFAKGTDTESSVDLCVSLNTREDVYQVGLKENRPLVLKGATILQGLDLTLKKEDKGWYFVGILTGLSLDGLISLAGIKSVPKVLPKGVVFTKIQVEVNTKTKFLNVGGYVEIPNDQKFFGININSIGATITRRAAGVPLDIKLSLYTGPMKLLNNDVLLESAEFDVSWVDQKLNGNFGVFLQVLGKRVGISGSIKDSQHLSLKGEVAKGQIWENLFGMKGLNIGDVSVQIEMDIKASPKVQSVAICGDLILGKAQPGAHGLSLCLSVDIVNKVFMLSSRKSPLTLGGVKLLDSISIKIEKLPGPSAWSFHGQVTGVDPYGLITALLKATGSKAKIPNLIPKGIIIQSLSVEGNTETNAWKAEGVVDMTAAPPIKQLGSLKLKSIAFEVGRDGKTSPPFFMLALHIDKFAPFPDLVISDPSSIMVAYRDKEVRVEGKMTIHIFKTPFEFSLKYENQQLSLSGGLAPSATRWKKPLGIPNFYMKKLNADIVLDFKKKPALRYLKVCGSGGFLTSPKKDLPLCIRADVDKQEYTVFSNGPGGSLTIGSAHLADKLALIARKEGSGWAVKGSLLELQLLVMIETLAGKKGEALPVPIRPGTIVSVLRAEAHSASGKFSAEGAVVFKGRGQNMMGIRVKQVGIALARESKNAKMDFKFTVKLGKTKLFEQVVIYESDIGFEWKNQVWTGHLKLHASIFGKGVILEGTATPTALKVKAKLPPKEKWDSFFGYRGIEVSQASIDLELSRAAQPKLVRLNFCGRFAFGKDRSVHFGLCVEAIPRKGLFRVYPLARPFKIGLGTGTIPLAFDIDLKLERIILAPNIGSYDVSGSFTKLDLHAFITCVLRIVAPGANLALPDFVPKPMILPYLKIGSMPDVPGKSFMGSGLLAFPDATRPKIFGFQLPDVAFKFEKPPLKGMNFAIKFKTTSWQVPSFPEVRFEPGHFDVQWFDRKLKVDVALPMVLFNTKVTVTGRIDKGQLALSVRVPELKMPDLFGLRGIFRLDGLAVDALIVKEKPNVRMLKVCGRGTLLANSLTDENSLSLCTVANISDGSFHVYNTNGPVILAQLRIADKISLRVKRLPLAGYRIRGKIQGVRIHALLKALMSKVGGGEMPPILPKGFAVKSLSIDVNTQTKDFNITGDVTTNFKLGGIQVKRVQFSVARDDSHPKVSFAFKLFVRGSLFEKNLIIKPSTLEIAHRGGQWKAEGLLRVKLFKKRTFTMRASMTRSRRATKIQVMAMLEKPWTVLDVEGAGALRLQTVGVSMTMRGGRTSWGVLCDGGFSINADPLTASFDGRLELIKPSGGALELRLTAKKPVAIGFPVPMPTVTPNPRIQLYLTQASLALRAKTCSFKGTVSATGFPVLGKSLEKVAVTVAVGKGGVEVTIVGFKVEGDVSFPPKGERTFGTLRYSIGPFSLKASKGAFSARADFQVGLPPEINTFFAGQEVFLPFRGTNDTMIRGEIGYNTVGGAYCRIKSRFLTIMRPVKPPPFSVIKQMAEEQTGKAVATASASAAAAQAQVQQAEDEVRKINVNSELSADEMIADLLTQVRFSDPDDPKAEWVGMTVPHVGDVHMVLPTFIYNPQRMMYMAKGDVYFPKGLSLPFGFFKGILKKNKASAWAAPLVPNDYKLNTFELFDKAGTPASPSKAVDLLNGLSKKAFRKPLPPFFAKIVQKLWRTLNLQNMPPAWKPHMRVNVPKRCKYYFKYTPPPGIGNIEFAFDFKGEELAFVAPAGPFLLGARIRYISAGAIMGGTAMIARVDADIQVMDLITMGMALVLPKGLLKTENSHFDIYMHNVTTLIHPATAGIPVPVFWDKLGWKFDILGGLRSEVTLQFPQPDVSPGKMLKLMKEFFSFCKDPKFFFPVPEWQTDDNGEGTDESKEKGIDLRLTIGKVYFMLPDWMGGVAIGDPEKGGDQISAKAMLNAIKKRRLDLIIEMLPFRLRTVTAELSFLGIQVKASMSISTSRELRRLARDDAPDLYYGDFRDYVVSLSDSRRDSFVSLTTIEKAGGNSQGDESSSDALDDKPKPIFFIGAGEWKFSKLAGFSIEYAWGINLGKKKLDVQAGFSMRGNMFVVIEVLIEGKIWLNMDAGNPKKNPPGISANGKAEIRMFDHPILTGTANYTTANGGGLGVSLAANLFPPQFPLECRGDIGGVFSRDKIQVEGGIKLGFRLLPAITFGSAHLFLNPDVGLRITTEVLNCKALLYLTKSGVKIELSSMGIKPLLYISGKSSMGGPLMIINSGKKTDDESSTDGAASASAKPSELEKQELAQQEVELARNPDRAMKGTDVLVQTSTDSDAYDDASSRRPRSDGPSVYLQGALTILGMRREVEALIDEHGAMFRLHGDFLGLISAEAIVETGPRLFLDTSAVNFTVLVNVEDFRGVVMGPLDELIKYHEDIINGLKTTLKTVKKLFEQTKQGLLKAYRKTVKACRTAHEALSKVLNQLKKLGVEWELPPLPDFPDDPLEGAFELPEEPDVLVSRNEYGTVSDILVDMRGSEQLHSSVHIRSRQGAKWGPIKKIFAAASAAFRSAKDSASDAADTVADTASDAADTVGDGAAQAAALGKKVFLETLKNTARIAQRKFSKLVNKALSEVKTLAKNPLLTRLVDRMSFLINKIVEAAKWVKNNIPTPSSVKIRRVEAKSSLAALQGRMSVSLSIDLEVGGKDKIFALEVNVGIKSLGDLAKQCFKMMLSVFRS